MSPVRTASYTCASREVVLDEATPMIATCARAVLAGQACASAARVLLTGHRCAGDDVREKKFPGRRGQSTVVGRFYDKTKEASCLNDYRQGNSGQAPEKRQISAKPGVRQRDALRGHGTLDTGA